MDLQESLSNSPSAVLKALVDKLKVELLEKERRSKAMAKAVAELKRELMEVAARAPPTNQDKKIKDEEEEDENEDPRTVANLRRRVEHLSARYIFHHMT